MRLHIIEMLGENIVVVNIVHDAWEVLYRSRDSEHAHSVQDACLGAVRYGHARALRGWGVDQQPRGLYEVREEKGRRIVPTLAPTVPDWTVWELHPRMSCWDVPVYVGINQNDAKAALAALRRSATIGALYWSQQGATDGSH